MSRNPHKSREILERSLPADVEAERCLLGSVLTDTTMLAEVLAVVRPVDLLEPANQRTLAELERMQLDGSAVDPMLLAGRLRDAGALEAVGGVHYLTGLIDATPTAAHAVAYASRVVKAAQARRMQLAGERFIQMAHEDGRDIDDRLAEMLQLVEGVGQVANRDSHCCDPVLQCLDDIEATSIRWFWRNRIAKGRLTLLVSKPGEGKSFLSTYLAANTSTGTPFPDGSPCERGSVLFIACEDDPSDTIRPRLDAHYADSKRIHLLTGVNRRDENGKVSEQMFSLADLAHATGVKADCVFNWIEKLLAPRLLRDFTASRWSTFASKLREAGLSESTIASYRAHLRAALQWAVNVGMLPSVPKLEKPKRTKGSKMMKGRPITREEFERMLSKVSSVVGGNHAAAWTFYLEGLWRSGLRLGESLNLWWDRNDKLRVELDGKRPMLQIRAEYEKGHKDRLLPMAPEFAELLQDVPAEQRTGQVFANLNTRRKPVSEWWVSSVVSLIGRKAGVVVEPAKGTPPAADANSGKPVKLTRTKDYKPAKYASAHDLRRAFGERWATRVMPQVLMELMRHESIETTLKFYVGRNAEKTADVLWEAHAASGNTFGNSGGSRASVKSS